MPDIGLTSATDPLNRRSRVVIKYSVEVDGLPVYQESYDADKLAAELAQDRENLVRLWFARLECVVKHRQDPRFSASITGCIADALEAGKT